MKSREFRINVKSLLINLFKIRGMIYKGFVSFGLSVNSLFYRDILKLLIVNARNCRETKTGLCTTTQLLQLRSWSSSYWSVITSTTDTLLAGLTTVTLLCSQKMKIKLNRSQFDTTKEIKKESWKVLRELNTANFIHGKNADNAILMQTLWRSQIIFLLGVGSFILFS